ncbi:MAG TPA: futalosine hydrolase [Bacteroidales bacterium]|nr:futalosine hydrolase [Bacteroidales bacterium]
MNILICAATPFELKAVFKKLLNEDCAHFPQKKQFGKAWLHFELTGMGPVLTAIKMEQLLVQNVFDLALNLGICGTFSEAILLGTALNITTDEFGDTGIEDHEQFYTLFDCKALPYNAFPYSDDQLINTNDNLIGLADSMRIKQASAITVAMASGSQRTINLRKKRFSADTESMEGAAFMLVCAMHKVPYLQIRTVSNLVEPRNKANWDIPMALNNLADTAEKLVLKICS